MYSIPILAVGMSIYLYKTNKYQIIYCSNMTSKKESSILSYSINKTNNDVIFPPDSPENQHQKHFTTSARSTNAFSPRIKILILLIGGSSFRINVQRYTGWRITITATAINTGYCLVYHEMCAHLYEPFWGSRPSCGI